MNVILALLLHVINPDNSLNDFKMRTQQICFMADCTGQHTKCIRNKNIWFLFNSMCWIQIWS